MIVVWELVTMEDSLWSKTRKTRSEARKLGLASSAKLGDYTSTIGHCDHFWEMEHGRGSCKRRISMQWTHRVLQEKGKGQLKIAQSSEMESFRLRKRTVVGAWASWAENGELKSGLSHELSNLRQIALPFVRLNFPPQLSGTNNVSYGFHGE